MEITRETHFSCDHVENEHDQIIYDQVCRLLRRPELVQGFLHEMQSDRLVFGSYDADHFAQLVMDDAAEILGRELIDRIVQYLWKIAESELSDTRLRVLH